MSGITTRITGVTLFPEGCDINSGHFFHVDVHNDGEDFVNLTQGTPQFGRQTIQFTPDEWVVVRDTVDRILAYGKEPAPEDKPGIGGMFTRESLSKKVPLGGKESSCEQEEPDRLPCRVCGKLPEMTDVALFCDAVLGQRLGCDKVDCTPVYGKDPNLVIKEWNRRVRQAALDQHQGASQCPESDERNRQAKIQKEDQ
jgi:hypothetical protein